MNSQYMHAAYQTDTSGTSLYSTQDYKIANAMHKKAFSQPNDTMNSEKRI